MEGEVNRIQQIVAFNLWRARVRQVIRMRRRVLQMRTVWRIPAKYKPH
jgi:hypothetical protein